MKKISILFLLVLIPFLMSCGFNEEQKNLDQEENEIFKRAVLYLLVANRSYNEISELHKDIVSKYNALLEIEVQIKKDQEQVRLKYQRLEELIEKLEAYLEKQDDSATEFIDNLDVESILDKEILEPIQEESVESTVKEKSEEPTNDDAEKETL